MSACGVARHRGHSGSETVPRWCCVHLACCQKAQVHRACVQVRVPEIPVCRYAMPAGGYWDRKELWPLKSEISPSTQSPSNLAQSASCILGFSGGL